MSTTTDENNSDKSDGGRLSRESSLGSNSLLPPVRRPTPTRRSVRDLHDDGIEQLSSPPSRTKHTPTTKPSSSHSRIYHERNQENPSSFASVNSGIRSSIGTNSLYPELNAADAKPSSSSRRRHSSENGARNTWKNHDEDDAKEFENGQETNLVAQKPASKYAAARPPRPNPGSAKRGGGNGRGTIGASYSNSMKSFSSHESYSGAVSVAVNEEDANGEIETISTYASSSTRYYSEDVPSAASMPGHASSSSSSRLDDTPGAIAMRGDSSTASSRNAADKPGAVAMPGGDYSNRYRQRELEKVEAAASRRGSAASVASTASGVSRNAHDTPGAVAISGGDYSSRYRQRELEKEAAAAASRRGSAASAASTASLGSRNAIDTPGAVAISGTSDYSSRYRQRELEKEAAAAASRRGSAASMASSVASSSSRCAAAAPSESTSVASSDHGVRKEGQMLVTTSTATTSAAAVASSTASMEDDQDLESKIVPNPTPGLTHAVDEDGRAVPGAYSAPGRAYGSFPIWGRHRPAPPPQYTQSNNGTLHVPASVVEEGNAEPQGNEVVLQATAIDPKDDETAEKTSWWQTKTCFFASLVLMIMVGVAVAVAIPMSLSNSSDSSEPSQASQSGGSGNSGPVELTRSPSVSPQPPPGTEPTRPETEPPSGPGSNPSTDVSVPVIVALQLDQEPQETGCFMYCDDKPVFEKQVGFYAGKENRRIVIPTQAPLGSTCVLRVEDSAGNGIEGFKMEVAIGENLVDSNNMFFTESSPFTSETELEFEVISTVTPRPTAAPTSFPPGVDSVSVRLFLKLDNYPAETGWELSCSDGFSADAPAGSYVNAREPINREFRITEGAQCTFVITDTHGDGICCGSNGDGYYVVTVNDRVEVVRSDFFFDEKQHPFKAVEAVQEPTLPPAATEAPVGTVSVAILLKTDWSPEETSLTLDCDGMKPIYAEAGELTELGGLYGAKVDVPRGTLCELSMRDLIGDGICCYYGGGAYILTVSYVGEEPLPILARGGKFGGNERVTFMAERPDISSIAIVTVVVVLDSNQEETSWTLQCGTLSMESSGFNTLDPLREGSLFVPRGTPCNLTVRDSGGNGITPFLPFDANRVNILVDGENKLGFNFDGQDETVEFVAE